MDLLEYQAKQLFTTVGIPVLPSQSISKPGDLKNLHIPYPIVLKSQVRAVGRGKAGGVKFVENTIDAIAASQTIFKLAIEEQYPEVILAEARYDAENEFFLAIMLDYQLKCPVLLGSSHGGIQIENLLKNMQICVIKDEFSPFQARRLAKKMGLKGELIISVSKIIEQMYHLFWEKDLEIIEINPLGISRDGEVMALDGKIKVNDYALARHPDLLKLIKSHKNENAFSSFSTENSEQNSEQNSAKILMNHSFFNVDEKGDIAVISNNLDSGILTYNLISEKKGKLGALFFVDENLELSLSQQLEIIFEQIFNTAHLKSILINVLANDTINQTIIDAISNFYQKELNSTINQSEERMARLTGVRNNFRDSKPTSSKIKKIKSNQPIQWVLRIVGNNLDTQLKNLTDLPIQLTEDFSQAVDLLL